MPTATTKKVARIRPAAGSNFQPKRVRKAARKKLISKKSVRGVLTNKVADARLAAAERAEFYRNLRQMKMARRKIATEMATLATMVAGLQREARRVMDRYSDVDAGLVEEAVHIVKQANAAVSTAADEMYTFSRKRVFFTQVAGVAA